MHNNIMAAGSKDRPPMLAPGIYPQWRLRFLRYVDTRPNGEALRKCILSGPYKPSTVLVHAVEATNNSLVDIQNNSALIAKYFKKIYKPTNNNLKTSSNSKNKNVDTTSRYKNDDHSGQFGTQRTVNVAGTREKVGSQVVQKTGIQCFNCKEYGHFAKECKKLKRVKDSAYHKEKMLLCKQAEQGVPLQAEQYDWLAETDEEVDEQELEAHYSYMAKIQEVPIADSGTNSEPVEQVQNNAEYNVFANGLQHSEQFESVSNIHLVETDDGNVTPDSPDMCEDDIQNDQNNVGSDDERVTLANLIVNLKLVVDENKKIQKQLKKANTTRSRTERTKQTEFEKYKAFNDRTVDYEKLEYSLERRYFPKTRSVLKTNVSEGLSKPVTAQNLPQVAKKAMSNTNVLRPGMYRIDNRTTHRRAPQLTQAVRNTNLHVSTSTGVNHKLNVSIPQLKSNQSRDKVLPNNSQVKYVESLEKEIDELESEKAEFSDMYDVILHDCVSKDVMCSYLHSLSDLDALAELQYLYLHKVKESSNDFRKEREQYFEIQDLKAQMQDKNIAISELKKLIEKGEGKYVDTKFDRPSIFRQPNAQRIPKPLVLGKPTPFSDSLERRYFPKTKSVSKANVSEGLSKPVTVQNLPQAAKKAFVPILGYGDLVQGNVTINWVYYVEGLNHNLFSVEWLWHRWLSHLNFDYINLLSKKDIVIGLPKLKYVKDQLCSSCELSKAKRSLFKSKVVPSSKGRGIEFLNKTLNAIFEKEGIEHQTSTAWTPKHNGVVERRNRTLVEVARTMLSASQLPLFFWTEDKFFNVGSNPSTNIQSTSAPSTHTNVHAEENHNDQAEKGEQLQNDEFTNPFCEPAQEEAESSLHNIEQVRGNPSRPVQTRRQLATDPKMCMFALTASTAEPKKIKEAMANSAWIEAMQEELHQFDRLHVGELVDKPFGKSIIRLKWLWKNKKDKDQTMDVKMAFLNVLLKEEVYVAQPEGFVDPDTYHAGCIDSRKSTYGGIQFLGDKLVSWMSKKQNCTAISSAEAEYVALSVKNGIIELYFVKTEYKLADMFNKALPEDRFKYLVRRIGMRCLTLAELEVLAKESA
nr:hypothetical protein [Tanacetum cinerariifolium]